MTRVPCTDKRDLDEEIERLRAVWGYHLVHALPDGSIAAIDKLVFTWSLVLGCDEWGWRYRFCFDKLALALEALAKADGVDFIPEGWIACRPDVQVLDEASGKPRYPTPDELRSLRAKVRAGRRA